MLLHRLSYLPRRTPPRWISTTSGRLVSTPNRILGSLASRVIGKRKPCDQLKLQSTQCGMCPCAAGNNRSLASSVTTVERDRALCKLAGTTLVLHPIPHPAAHVRRWLSVPSEHFGASSETHHHCPPNVATTHHETAAMVTLQQPFILQRVCGQTAQLPNLLGVP